MNTSRVIRGARAKNILYMCALVIIIGIVACYNNTLSQLDGVRKLNYICHQEEDDLSTQLRILSNYTQRLEKSLKTEKAEHRQTEIAFIEEKAKNKKLLHDSNLELNSLQQYFKLIKYEYDHCKEECNKNQKQQHEEINDLQSKFKEVFEKLRRIEEDRTSLKSQVLNLQSAKENVEQQLKKKQENKNLNSSDINPITNENRQIKSELELLTERWMNQDMLQEPKLPTDVSLPKRFTEIYRVRPSVYQINKSGLEPTETKVLKAPVVENQQKDYLDLPSKDSSKFHISKSTMKSGMNVEVRIPEEHRLPGGIVAVPDKKEDVIEPPEIINKRHQNVKDSAIENIAEKPTKEEIDKDEAHEDFDGSVAQNEDLRLGENERITQNQIIGLGLNDKKNYDHADKDLQNDVPMEENEVDDIADGH